MTIFHPDSYRTDRKARSWWEASANCRDAPALDRDETTEVAIIGGGYAGMSAALHLSRDHGISAVVLEAGPIGWGASGRNGGFASIPATKLSVHQMTTRYGADETDRFYREAGAAVERLRALIRDLGLDVDLQGDCHFEVAHHPSAVEDVKAGATLYRKRFGFDTDFLSAEEFAKIGHGGTEQFGAMRHRGPYGLHPLKLMAGLREAAEASGAKVFGHSRVLEWTKQNGTHRLRTEGGTVSARHVILATNGYTPDDLHPAFANRTLPAFSNIIVTRPLSEDERRAAGWHTEAPCANARPLLFYYRLLPDGRFLFGSRGGTSGTPTEDMRRKAWLIRRLGELFPEWKGVDVPYFWSGLVCLTRRLTPAIGRLPEDPSISFGFGWHGNGVVAATDGGRRLAAAIAKGGSGPIDVPAPMAGLPAGMLHPLLRRYGLKAAYLMYHLKQWSSEGRII